MFEATVDLEKRTHGDNSRNEGRGMKQTDDRLRCF